MATIKTYGFDEIRRMHNDNPANNEEIERRLRYIGRELCNHARQNGAYTDRTSNLRSSIGFSILYNGEVVSTGGFQGKQTGIEAAQEALARYGDDHPIPMVGWGLLVVAGMSYATYVEAKGYNVLSLTEVLLKEKIEQLRKELNLG